MDERSQAGSERANPTVSKEFLQAVRSAAGWRVSPRQVATALEALDETGDDLTPARVAEVASASRGDRSQRQRRHADLWRALGAQLVVRERSGDPEAQRAFVREAREAAGRSPSDALILQIALEVAASGDALDPELVGALSRWIRRNQGPSPSGEEIAEALPQAMEAALDAREQSRRARQRRMKQGTAFLSESMDLAPRRSPGRRPRGSSYGGKRRRRS